MKKMGANTFIYLLVGDSSIKHVSSYSMKDALARQSTELKRK